MFKVDVRLKGLKGRTDWNVSSSCYEFTAFRLDPALCPHCTGLHAFGVHVLLLQLATPFRGELPQLALRGSVQELGSYFVCCRWWTDLSEEDRCGGNTDFINLPNKSSPAPIPFWQHLLGLQPVQPLLSPEVGNFLAYLFITAFVFWPLLQKVCVFTC